MGIIAAFPPDMQDASVFIDQPGLYNSPVFPGQSYSWRTLNSQFSFGLPGSSEYYIKTRQYVTGGNEATEYYLYIREGDTCHLSINFNTASGRIDVRRGGNTGTLLGSTPSGELGLNQWYCIEVYARIHDTTGAVIVRIEGVEKLSLANVDTRNGGTSGVIDNIYARNAFGTTRYWTDIVVCDTSWAGPGTFTMLTVTADGDDTGWEASAGSPYQCVDEVPANNFTDYIRKAVSAAGSKATFQMANLPGSAYTSITGVVVVTRARTDSSGGGLMRAIAKSGSSYGNGPTRGLSASAGTHFAMFNTDPATGAAWTKNGVDNAQFGVEVI